MIMCTAPVKNKTYIYIHPERFTNSLKELLVFANKILLILPLFPNPRIQIYVHKEYSYYYW